jgi:hypothetical protein
MLKLPVFALLLTSVAATAKPLEVNVDELVATPRSSSMASVGTESGI